jgi:hypothetical protein
VGSIDDRARPIHRSIKSRDWERFFSMQREAMAAAIWLANDSGKEGKPAVVLFQKSKTQFEKIWTYGESAYPSARSDLLAMSRLSRQNWRTPSDKATAARR